MCLFHEEIDSQTAPGSSVPWRHLGVLAKEEDGLLIPIFLPRLVIDYVVNEIM